MRDVFVLIVNFISCITLSLPIYTGRIRLNSRVNWIKISNVYEKTLDLSTVARNTQSSDSFYNSVIVTFGCDMMFHMVKHGDIQSIFCDIRHATTTLLGICSRFLHHV